MNIVKESPHNRVFIGNCLACDAVIESKENELQITIANDDGNKSDNDIATGTKCPSCSHKGSVVFKPKPKRKKPIGGRPIVIGLDD